MKPTEKEQLAQLYEYYNYRCFVCGDRATQRAHIIGDTKKNRRKHGAEIIDNPLNWLPACCLHCNSLIDISNNPIAESYILDAIMYAEDGAREYIEGVVRENVNRKMNKK